MKSAGRIAFVTVNGDLHDISNNLANLTLEGVGFEVTAMGVDGMALFVLLTTTMP